MTRAVTGKTVTKSRKAASRAGAADGSPKTAKLGKATQSSPSPQSAEVKLLSGGNPQIAKADGDPAVQAYIAAMPGWKCDLGRRLDAIITTAVPDVRKAVKWNSPFYGSAGDGPKQDWFLNFHCFTKYVKIAFFRGMSLRPVPPGASKSQDTRYLDIYEDGDFDEAQFADWVRQANRLPGERL